MKVPRIEENYKCTVHYKYTIKILYIYKPAIYLVNEYLLGDCHVLGAGATNFSLSFLSVYHEPSNVLHVLTCLSSQGPVLQSGETGQREVK